MTTRSYFVAAKGVETSWSNRASLTYSEDIQGRKLLNEGQNWLAAAIGQITELLTGVNYRVEDYPLVWIEDTYYTTYKDNIFQVSVKTDVPTQAEYDAVTTIDLENQSLTTDFSNTFLSKFSNLLNLIISENSGVTICEVQNLTSLINLKLKRCSVSVLDVTNSVDLVDLVVDENNIEVLDISNLTELESLVCNNNLIEVLDLTNCTLLETAAIQRNNISTIDISNCTLLDFLRCDNNELDANVNSQILIDLDGHGLSNGFLRSSIFGGGSLTAAGQTAKANLQAKGWSIVGI